MWNFSTWPFNRLTLLILGITTGTVASLVAYAPISVNAAPASTAKFSDIKTHWARPFIEALAAKNIIAGYIDGTFRPNQPVDRDEFAAIVSQAFNQNQVRQINSGTMYKDVPSAYWAAPAIKEAYETGFMNGYSGGFFRPRTEISRAQALVDIANGLHMSSSSSTSSANQKIAAPALQNQANVQSIAYQPSPRRLAKKRFFMPLASAALMQPVFMAAATAQTMPLSRQNSLLSSNKGLAPKAPALSSAKSKNASPTSSPSFALSKYYADANKIPLSAVPSVVAATQANIVASYPNPRMLNPNQPATRGDAAAFIYQALVHQGKMKPLSNKAVASKYIINPNNSAVDRK